MSARDHRTLLKEDVLGERPNLEKSAPMKELKSMVGITAVKAAVNSLMHLQLQNYDREMRGDMPEQISLHRVFFGTAAAAVACFLLGCFLVLHTAVTTITNCSCTSC